MAVANQALTMRQALAALAVQVVVVVVMTLDLIITAALALLIKVMQVVNRFLIFLVVQALGAQGAALAVLVETRLALILKQAAQVVWGLHGLMAKFTHAAELAQAVVIAQS